MTINTSCDRIGEARAFAASATESMQATNLHANFGWWVCTLILEIRPGTDIGSELAKSKTKQYLFIYRFWRNASLSELSQFKALYWQRQGELNLPKDGNHVNH